MEENSVPIDEDRLLTASELARILGVDRATLRNWVKIGQIPSIKIGPRIRRFRRSEVERWLKNSSQGSEAAK